MRKKTIKLSADQKACINDALKGNNLLITGQAGTGKSAVVEHLVNKLESNGINVAVTASTGVAAVNIGGMTVHAWSGIGICDKTVIACAATITNNENRSAAINTTDVLIIDEVSMLDAATFQYLDAVLRIVRNHPSPFGGLQVILFGDFLQLPPVRTRNCKGDQGKWLFQCKLFNEAKFSTHVLTHIWRQENPEHCEMLQQLRKGIVTEPMSVLLRERAAAPIPTDKEPIEIYCKNVDVDNVNNNRLDEIDQPLLEFEGNINNGSQYGEILNENYTGVTRMYREIRDKHNAKLNLRLKVGARVMLLTNLDVKEGLCNGALGTVKKCEGSYIYVYFDCTEEPDTKDNWTKIEEHSWEFYIDEKHAFTYKQFPLRLAYAITCHKSQGQTYDSAIIDLSRVFEAGQSYVALSRVKDLNQVYITGSAPGCIYADKMALAFYSKFEIPEKE